MNGTPPARATNVSIISGGTRHGAARARQSVLTSSSLNGDNQRVMRVAAAAAPSDGKTVRYVFAASSAVSARTATTQQADVSDSVPNTRERMDHDAGSAHCASSITMANGASSLTPATRSFSAVNT